MDYELLLQISLQHLSERVRIKLNINGNNIYSAYSKARRMYPQADKIQVTQTERIK